MTLKAVAFKSGWAPSLARPEKNPPFPCGGDSWALPSVAAFAAGVRRDVNDFSNMNGGFFPPHGPHRKGLDIDGDYSGYCNRDGAAAVRMLEYLRQYGRKIDKVFVAYDVTPCDPAKDATALGF
jgi:hypothetical protein